MCEREIYNSKWSESARESGGEIDRQIKCETAYNRVGTGWWVRAHSHIHSRLVNDVTFTIRGPTGRKESGTWHTSLALLYCFYHMSTMHLKSSLVWLNMSWFQIQSINQSINLRNGSGVAQHTFYEILPMHQHLLPRRALRISGQHCYETRFADSFSHTFTRIQEAELKIPLPESRCTTLLYVENKVYRFQLP